jgi:NAD(P)H-hydrate epimerase
MEMLRLRTGISEYTSLEDEMTASGYTGDDKINYIKENAFETAKLFSDRYGVICILKDARTVVSCTGYLSDKNEALMYLNTTGNNGMSTGGSGDVLAGILAGILAQNRDERMTVYEASCLAVNIHGRAGDLAAAKRGCHSMMATDIVNNISRVLENIQNN